MCVPVHLYINAVTEKKLLSFYFVQFVNVNVDCVKLLIHTVYSFVYPKHSALLESRTVLIDIPSTDTFR